MIIKIACLLSLCLSLNSCVSPNGKSDCCKEKKPFAGNWQGSGTDAEGNEFTFAAKVIHQGGNRYRILVLDRIDTLKKPLHVMDGVLKNNEFTYTADDKLYVGGGKLDKEKFTGFYKGPVDGIYTMWRMEPAKGDKDV